VIEGPTIIWAASRAGSGAEREILAQIAQAANARTLATPMSLLGKDILSLLVQGPVVVIVDSKKDATVALRLGADEIVRVAQSVALQKSALQDAVERAVEESRARTQPPASAVRHEYPGLALLLQVVERQLGSPLNQAALKCNELAGELTKAVAVADGLMQRVRRGSSRDEIGRWSRDVKHYAQATLRAETLVSELREQVERGEAVIRLLGDLSAGVSATKTDVASLLEQFAELLRVDLGNDLSVEVITNGPCFVEMARSELLCIICAAVETALENIHAVADQGHLELRASSTVTDVLIEVADNGIPNATDLRATIIDPLLVNPRTARLRQLRERVRGADGELTVDADDGGTVVLIHLPMYSESPRMAPVPRASALDVERRNH
jgi:hypothetical protein